VLWGQQHPLSLQEVFVPERDVGEKHEQHTAIHPSTGSPSPLTLTHQKKRMKKTTIRSKMTTSAVTSSRSHFLFDNCILSCLAGFRHSLAFSDEEPPPLDELVHYQREKMLVHELSDDETEGLVDDNSTEEMDEESNKRSRNSKNNNDEDYQKLLEQQRKQTSTEYEAYNLLFEQDEMELHLKSSPNINNNNNNNNNGMQMVNTFSYFKNRSSTSSQVRPKENSLSVSSVSKSGNVNNILTEDEIYEWSMYKSDHFHSIDESEEQHETSEENDQMQSIATQPDISVEKESNHLTDEPQDRTDKRITNPNVQVQHMEELIDDEDPFSHIGNEAEEDEDFI
jgi:hypothetical protein